jgi:predicted nucleic-acid-binding protein
MSYNNTVKNLLPSVAIELKDIIIGATYLPHRVIAGFSKTLFINTGTAMPCNTIEDKLYSGPQ